jgi:hypothetical protein
MKGKPVTEFEQPAFWSPRVALGRLLLLVACLGFAVWFSIRDGALSAGGLGFDFFVVFFAISVWLPMQTFARRVALDADGLEARTYLGRRTSIVWSDVCLTQEFQMRNLNRLLAFRVVSTSGTEAIFTSLIRGYPRLTAQIRSRVSDVETDDGLAWWKRLVLG